MNCMATLKHIASKNSAYTAIEAYLVYQHDAFTGKQLLDEHGRPMLRESYILDTLECGDFSFATACLLANRKYNKNNHPDDIKSHQYIISFDPRYAADNGLTMEKAQALGLNFCKENFPGHPAIVCTHPDGHNHSGNIHVHIVIGSVRTREVERKPYMQKPRDWREGIKHSSTAQTMRHLRVEVMELCEGVGLYQIDLLNGSKERVSEAEYWARRRGQMKLDRENVALEELTTRFRISFNYQLEQMPDNAQRDVILEIINIPAIRILWNWANKATIQASCWMAQWKSFCMMKMAIRSASAGWQVGRFSGPNWPVPAGVPVRSACGPTQTVRCSGWISVRSCPSRP